MGEAVALPPPVSFAGAHQTPRSEPKLEPTARDVRARSREGLADAQAPEGRQPDTARAGSVVEGQDLAVSRGRLSISLDAETQTMVYRSVDPDSGSIMWQWPAEQTLRMVKFLRELEGLDRAGAKPKAIDQQA